MELTQKLVKELFEYRDGGLYRKETKGGGVKGERFGSIDKKKRYRKGHINYKNFTEHRLIYLYFYGELPVSVDHINGDTTDNRIENLRKASLSQNQHNSKKNKNNSSGHKGVSWDKSKNKWKVAVWLKSKIVFQKVFHDFELACLVADEARNLYHKEYARHG